jgi:hypothetical protein
MTVDLFDPTMSPDKKTIDYVPRPQNLEGLKVGLVDNTKFNSDTLLAKISERLQTRFNTEMVCITKKQSAGHPIADSAIKEMKAKADVVIAGIGD